uniref:Lunapark zinc ribbon domain-containing protein n=1 Tax=Leersia perrieri TaxID=77586 RepID=A0A0D9VIL7_9ORYZ
MASSPEAEAAAAAGEAVAKVAEEEKGKGKEGRRGGVLGRMWRALFGGREDYEKRLQYLSKEEAAVHARMRRRTQFSRRAVRNLVVLTVLAEVVAIVYAIMTTRNEDIPWQLRAIRVLPIFVLPAVSSVIYSSVVKFTRMLERKDQKTLEKLRAERKAKIDELKERTNYYLTQQLIQKYDLDPAAKAAAASVLASKLGEETGLKVHVGEEPNLDAAVARSNDVEILPSDGLRNRKQSNAKGSRTGGTTAAQTPAQGAESSLISSSGLETVQNPMVVEHFQGSGASDGGWIAKIAALLVGEDPSQSYALICGNCHMHNGLARKEDYPHITYYCPHCHALNASKQSMGQYSGSNSGRSTPVAPADGISASSSVVESEVSNMTTVPELKNEKNTEKQEGAQPLREHFAPSAAMDRGVELMGCVCRIKNCAVELLEMEDDLVIDMDDDSWDLFWSDLRIKSTFLYIDLSRVISCSESDERKEALTLLTNKLLYFLEELADAATSGSVSFTKLCYSDAAQVLRDVVAFLAPPQ